ncbi:MULTISPECIES: hypothetical protein [unclassified Diaminobutyricimonas]|uniref:hypothetical protein n=1 Tax=unclassified Diaminobutyricimonas TaxID=2643261 RepID=UPI0012F490F0|nr:MULTISPECIES: hypothetical protein [unclassified Diaminobutyricimonas]
MKTLSPVGILLGGAVLLLSGCASSSGSGVGSGPAPEPGPATGEVIAQATVLQVEPDAAMLCLGAVAESYPPQCSGPEITNWDWAAVEMSETSQAVTWGSYAVQGTWDGEAFTVTEPPIPLALYDPMAQVDPRQDPQNAGATSEDRLIEIQEKLWNSDALELLTSAPANGYLWVHVPYDDGSIQDYVDGQYGADVVIVQSAMRPVG